MLLQATESIISLIAHGVNLEGFLCSKSKELVGRVL